MALPSHGRHISGRDLDARRGVLPMLGPQIGYKRRLVYFSSVELFKQNNVRFKGSVLRVPGSEVQDTALKAGFIGSIGLIGLISSIGPV